MLGLRALSVRPRPSARCSGLKENVAALPSVSGIKRIALPQLEHAIEPVPGKMASVAIYSHLASKYGHLSAAAAKEALELYAEAAEDAKLHPGSHPNIDLLFLVLESGNHVDIVVERE